MRILNAFSIHYTVVHDEDPLLEPIPDDWSGDKVREKRRTFDLNRHIRELLDQELGSIEMCCPNFEREGGISRSSGDKKGKPIAALEHFETKEIAQLPDRLVEIVRSSFA